LERSIELTRSYPYLALHWYHPISHRTYRLILYFNSQVDENVTAEKPQAADDGKEVKKWVY
jgi:hypothetical protein